MAGAVVDFYFSFRSPYSYVAAPRAFALTERYDVAVNYCGVRPMVTRGVPLPRAKSLYIVRDALREARRLGMPFGPMFDPLGDGALRCLAVTELANDKSQDLTRRAVLRLSRAIWAEAADVADDGVLEPLCEEIGLDWKACRAAFSDAGYAARIEENIARLREAGHWGVPTFVFAGDVFWGQDRIEDLEGVLAQAGLEKKSR